MNQYDDGTDPRPSRNVDAMPDTLLICEKGFHHNNLRLQLLFDQAMRVYTINVHRMNDGSNHDMWGVWMMDDGTDEAAALAKFESIRL